MSNLIAVTIENFKKIKAMQLNFDKNNNSVFITGKNEQGKSSSIDAIEFGLRGKAAIKGTTKPIRDGQESAQVKIETDDFIINRKINPKSDSLEVTNKDGLAFKSPQAVLDRLFGAYMDPWQFVIMKSEAQIKILCELINFDLVAWDIDYKMKYEERTIDNRELSRIVQLLDSAPAFPEDLPREIISVSELSTELEEILKKEKHREIYQKELDTLEVQLMKDVESMNYYVDLINSHEKDMKELQIKIDAIPGQTELIDSKKKEIAESETTNATIIQKKEWLKNYNNEADQRKKVETLNDQLQDMADNRRDAIAKAELPIDGLSFNDYGITLHNIPFEQCSRAQKIKAAMGIMFSINQELKILFIRDGNTLDASSLKLVDDMAKENGFHILIELVQEEPDGKSIYIYDGEVFDG